VGNQAFEAMQSTIARHKLAVYPPDYLIEIPSNAASLMDFDKADELIELGQQYGRRCVEEIAEKTNSE
jgi:NTE family protein